MRQPRRSAEASDAIRAHKPAVQIADLSIASRQQVIELFEGLHLV
jgi:hypothetical protein